MYYLLPLKNQTINKGAGYEIKSCFTFDNQSSTFQFAFHFFPLFSLEA